MVALLDSEVDQNIISYDLWDAFKKLEISSSTISFWIFFKSTTMSQGKFYLKLCIGDQSMHSTFHVAQKGQVSVGMILGWSWMAQTHCLIDWSSWSSTLHINSTKITSFSADIPSTTLKTPLRELMSKTIPLHKQPLWFGFKMRKTMILGGKCLEPFFLQKHKVENHTT